MNNNRKLIFIVFTLLVLISPHIGAQTVQCNNYIEDINALFLKLSDELYPIISKKNYDENQEISFDEIRKILNENKDINELMRSSTEEIFNEYSDCQLENPLEEYYNGVILTYTQICENMNRGITIENINDVGKEELISGHCKVTGNLNEEISAEANKKLQTYINEYEKLIEKEVKSTKKNIEKKSSFESFEKFIYENFGSLIDKLPFEDRKTNFYLFVFIIFILLYYVLLKR